MPDQAKSKKRKLFPKFGIRFLLLVLLVVSLPLAWLAGILNEHRIENNFVREANIISEASGYESFCTKRYDFELARQTAPSPKGVAGWLGVFILESLDGLQTVLELEALNLEGCDALADASAIKKLFSVQVSPISIRKKLQDKGILIPTED